MPEDFRYKTTLTAHLHAIKPSEELKKLATEKIAVASLEKLKPLLPPDINPADSPDLLYVVGNLAVANLVNLNDDAIDIETALAIYKGFENKPCDIEHDRGKIVGFILKAGLSKYGTDDLITEDEARALNGPFNIATVAVLWRTINPQLCKFIEEASTPGTPYYKDLSLSFEISFNNYNIGIGKTRNIADAKIISSDDPKFESYSKALKINEGTGKEGDDIVFRLITLPIKSAGQGIVTEPAAAVKGLLAITNELSDGDDDVEAKARKAVKKLLENVAAYIIKLPKIWTEKLSNSPESGMGYQKVKVTLTDGTIYKDLIVENGENLKTPELFLPEEIASIDFNVVQEDKYLKNIDRALPPKNVDVTQSHIKGHAIPIPTKFQGPYSAIPKDQEVNYRVNVTLSDGTSYTNLPTWEGNIDSPNPFRSDEISSLTIFDISKQENKKDEKSVKNSVLVNKNSNSNKTNMPKITNLKEFLANAAEAVKPENQQETFASLGLIADEIVKASEKMEKEKKDLQAKAEAAEKEKQDLHEKHQKMMQDMEALRTQIDEMKKAHDAAEKEHKFNERMAAFDMDYNLVPEDRKIIADDIKDLDDDAFKKYTEKASVLMKEKSKAYQAAKHKELTDKLASAKIKLNEKNEIDVQELIASAKNNIVDAGLPVDKSQLSGGETLKDKAAKAFGSATVGGKKIDGSDRKK